MARVILSPPGVGHPTAFPFGVQLGFDTPLVTPPFLSDAFAGSGALSSHIANTGQGYSDTNSIGYPTGLIISPSGAVRAGTNAAWTRSLATPPNANYRVESPIIRRSALTANPRVYMRSNATGNLDSYFVEYNPDLGKIILWKFASGSATNLAEAAITWATGDTKLIAIQAVGNLITVEVSTDGGATWTHPFAGVSDSTYSAAGTIALSNDTAATDTTGTAFLGLTGKLVSGVAFPFTAANGDSGYIRTPLGDNPATARPLIMLFHGSGGTAQSSMEAAILQPSIEAWLAQGWRVMAMNGGGENWGNPQSVTDNEGGYTQVAGIWNTSKTLFWDGSMGSLASLNLITNTASIPNLKGIYSICPACNLANDYATFATALINTAYGITGTPPDTYALKTAGSDPCLKTGSDFRNFRYRFVASPDDTLVPQTMNTDVLMAILSGLSIEDSLLEVTGAHGSPEHYVPADSVAFFQRCLAD